MTFNQIKEARLAVKAERAKIHAALLASRYDLKEATGEARMSGGKAVPIGPTARLSGATWEQLDKMTPEQIKEKGLFPYPPLPFPDHVEGGMLFPKMTIDVLPRLTRFDVDFDLPEHVLPEKAPPIFLMTRPDLGDVSSGAEGALILLAAASICWTSIERLLHHTRDCRRTLPCPKPWLITSCE